MVGVNRKLVTFTPITLTTRLKKFLINFSFHLSKENSIRLYDSVKSLMLGILITVLFQTHLKEDKYGRERLMKGGVDSKCYKVPSNSFERGDITRVQEVWYSYTDYLLFLVLVTHSSCSSGVPPSSLFDRFSVSKKRRNR